ncbi:hypothetical protein [Streptomyces virginiae]
MGPPPGAYPPQPADGPATRRPRDCIVPYNGYYNQHSWLSKPGSATAALADTNQLHLSGTYTFGSELAPKF